MEQLIDILRHLPEHLQGWAEAYGVGLYLIVALIIFCETGLVVTPLLPGDSLLFAVGALLAGGLPGLNLPTMALALIAATFCGDLVNYHVGRWLAPKIFDSGKLKFVNRNHLAKTQKFFAHHGGKTVILARFLPIVRTYAPFVAGMGAFSLGRFIAFSLTGAILWIALFLNLGYFFGNIPVVKKNFELVILAIVAISLAPIVIEFIRSHLRTRATS